MSKSPQHDPEPDHERTSTAEHAGIRPHAALTPFAAQSERVHVVSLRPGTSDLDWIRLERFDLRMVLNDKRRLLRDFEEV
jgi:hypothetical protein